MRLSSVIVVMYSKKTPCLPKWLGERARYGASIAGMLLCCTSAMVSVHDRRVFITTTNTCDIDISLLQRLSHYGRLLAIIGI